MWPRGGLTGAFVGILKPEGARYETFRADQAAANAFAEKLNARAKAKRIGKLEAVTKDEAADLRWAVDKLAMQYGATVKEAAEWFVKTKFPEKEIKLSGRLVKFT